MTGRVLPIALAAIALTGLSACNRGGQAPMMNAAALNDDDRGARAGRFLPAADNTADANASMADNAANESAP